MRLLRSHFPLPLTIVNCNDEQLGCCRIRFAHSEGPNFQLVCMLGILLWKISGLNHQSFGICIVSSTILSKYLSIDATTTPPKEVNKTAIISKTKIFSSKPGKKIIASMNREISYFLQ